MCQNFVSLTSCGVKPFIKLIFFVAYSLCSPSFPECSKDDQGVHGQEIWQLVARGDRWRFRLWGHAWGEEPALHVLWRKPGCVRVEVLVAPSCYASSPLTWSLDWDWTPATSQMLVKFVLRQVSLSTLPATVADRNIVWKPCPVLKCSWQGKYLKGNFESGSHLGWRV